MVSLCNIPLRTKERTANMLVQPTLRQNLFSLEAINVRSIKKLVEILNQE